MIRTPLWHFLLVLVPLMFIASCSGNKHDHSVIERGNADAAGVELLLREVLSSKLAEQQGKSRPDVSNDTAAFVHDKALFEAWTFLAIVHDNSKNAYSLQQRFIRFNLSADDPVDGDASQWHFSSLVAVDYQFDRLSPAKPSDERRNRQSLAQRASLGLAGSDALNGRVWLGAYEVIDQSRSQCELSIQLLSPELEIKFGEQNSIGEMPDCYANNAENSLALNRVMSVGTDALPVSGVYRLGAENIPIQGYGWIERTWGDAPVLSGAAVVFDQAWLLLQEQSEIQLQRSRRASGRGPQLTTGFVRSLNEQATKRGSNLEAQLDRVKLEGKLVDGKSMPESKNALAWTLNSKPQGIDVNLKPVFINSANSTVAGLSWFDVVEIEGTHSGFGFINNSLR